MKQIIGRFSVLFLVLIFFAQIARAEDEAVKPKELPVIEAVLGTAPNVPPVIERDYEAKVIVRLSSDEYRGDLSKGVQYDYWGYNKQVPGPFVRGREGGTIEFHFKNSGSSKNSHTIDFHAM